MKKNLFVIILILVNIIFITLSSFSVVKAENRSSQSISVFAVIDEQIGFTVSNNALNILTNYRKGLCLFGNNSQFQAHSPIQKTIPFKDSFILVANF